MRLLTHLQSLVHLTSGRRPKLTTFHASWGPGHNSTDYPRFFSLPPGSGQVYEVTTYQSAYEPYVIMGKRVSWCDERFTGYGGNKAACIFEMYISGVSFYVLSDHFIVHQNHLYEEKARKDEVSTPLRISHLHATADLFASGNSTRRFTPTLRKRLVCGIR